MKHYYFLFILIFVFSLTNCNESDNVVSSQPTLGEINAEIIQNYINENNPSVASAYVYDYVNNKWINDNFNTSCGGFKVESPYIVICDVYYNLEYLFKYENNGGDLQLYFNH